MEYDLGTSSVTVNNEQISKISITSTKLGIVTAGTVQTGYATYQVMDQYGNDITDLPISNNIVFQSGVGSVTGNKGLLTLTANTSTGINLMTFASVVITGYDSTTGVSTSATLATTTQVGTLSSCLLGSALTNVNNATLTAGDTTDVFYLPYTATDISGNVTSNYDLLKGGLITTTDSNGNADCLTTSSPYVEARIIEDPTNSANAVIQVTADSTAISMDMPVVITAMTWTGQTSSMNVTLKKASTLSAITLESPANEVATNEATVIPFAAYDQNGNAVTSYSSFFDGSGNPLVSLSNAKLEENADGSAEIVAGPTGTGFPANGQQVITATTTAGKYSTLTLSVQDAAIASQLQLDPTVVLSTMQTGSTQNIDFGYKYDGLTALDQYDRTFDMTGKPGNYEVVASSNSSNVVVTNPDISGSNFATITAGPTAGTATVTFNLIDKTNPTVVIDSKSVTVSVVNSTTSITGYTMAAPATPLYAELATGTTLLPTSLALTTGIVSDYAFNPTIYGTTSTGGKIAVGSKILGASVSDPTDFAVTYGTASNSVYVAAVKPVNTDTTTESATLSVTVMGTDGLVHTVTTPITSSTATPVAASLGIHVDTTKPGISVDTTGNNVTINEATTTLAAGNYLTQYIPTTTLSGAATNSPIYFTPKDQYGVTDMNLSQFIQTSATNSAGASDSTQYISSTGEILAMPAAGTTVTLTGVTRGGLTKTINLIFTNAAVTSTGTTTTTASSMGTFGVTPAVAAVAAVPAVAAVAAVPAVTGVTAVPAVAATGTITYGTPVANDTVTVGTTVFTNTVAPGNGTTTYSNAAELVTAINASVPTVTATNNAGTITVTDNTAGTAGNAIALSKSGTGTTTVPTTLSGGVAAVTAVTAVPAVAAVTAVPAVTAVTAVPETGNLTMLAATVAGNIVVTVNGTVYTVPVLATDSSVQVAGKVAAAIGTVIPGYTVSNTNSTITFTSTATGNPTITATAVQQ